MSRAMPMTKAVVPILLSQLAPSFSSRVASCSLLAGPVATRGRLAERANEGDDCEIGGGGAVAECGSDAAGWVEGEATGGAGRDGTDDGGAGDGCGVVALTGGVISILGDCGGGSDGVWTAGGGEATVWAVSDGVADASAGGLASKVADLICARSWVMACSRA